MKQVIQITDKILGVIVPIDATKFELFNKESLQTAILVIKEYSCYPLVIPNGDYKIHGTCTLPAFDFDFEVDEIWVKNTEEKLTWKKYYNYHTRLYSLDSAKESFRTRILNAIYDAGLLLVNPIDIKGQTFSNEHQNKWQESESKVIRGKLLIIEKI